MPAKFFTNGQNDSTLFKQFTGIAQAMGDFHTFKALSGYFRSSGYFKLREHLEKAQEIRILVGIDVDKLFAEAYNRAQSFFANQDRTIEEFLKVYKKDIEDAKYTKEIDRGMLQLYEDLQSGKVEIRAHPTKTLHAKFYLFLPKEHSQYSDGWVIMGSSNLTDAGMGIKNSPNYEMNIACKDFDDVSFAEQQFETLWKEAVPILKEHLEGVLKNTHLAPRLQNCSLFTPWEIYIKFLIEYFGNRIEYDPNIIGDIPKQYKKLSYQIDAVNQGFQILLEHNGFFLADVVGTGKTVIAAMLAQRFIIENGQGTNILIVYPPAIESNWKNTFKNFGLKKHTHFITHDSLHKIVDGKSKDYLCKKEYDLILIDESHKYRSNETDKYKNLQEICRTGRKYKGGIDGERKKIVLISATPLNNYPSDIRNQIELFEDIYKSTLPTSNLQTFFVKIEKEYKAAMEKNDVKKIQDIYIELRKTVLEHITVRRTRKDLKKIPEYKKDIDKEKIIFPEIDLPRDIPYNLNEQEEEIFKDTIDKIENQIRYFRYRAIENLVPQVREKFFPDVTDVMINALTGIIRTGLVKRMESSFYAFRESIKRHIASLDNMLDMFSRNEIFVGGISNLNELIAKGVDFAEIEKRVIDKGGQKFTSADFDSGYLTNIKNDKTIFEKILNDWKNVTRDPKLDEFIKAESRYFDTNENKTGKLVIFSESLDTATYLSGKIENLLPKHKGKVLLISSENRKELFETIQDNFDANYEEFLENPSNPKFNAYDIIVSTDVLAEGVNLHRANVIVNYDTPWNATKLMQRLGRVNRIGSTSQWVYNYCFYPSAQGEDIIKNKQKAQIKIQAFHTAFGEDAKIYTIDEMIQDVKLYEQGIAGFDGEDETLKLLWKIRHLQEKNPKEFERIKNLPLKAATARKYETKSDSSIVFLKSDYKIAFYKIENNVANALTFEQAEELFRAEEKESPFTLPNQHYDNVELARKEYEQEFQNQMAVQQQVAANNRGSVQKSTALKNLRGIQNSLSQVGTQALQTIYVNIESGRFAGLENEINKLFKKESSAKELEKSIMSIAKNYEAAPPLNIVLDKDVNPKIVLSESFLEK